MPKGVISQNQRMWEGLREYTDEEGRSFQKHAYDGMPILMIGTGAYQE